MNIQIYSSHFIAEKHFLGSPTLSQYFLLASWLSKENLFLDNVSLNNKTKTIINFLNSIDYSVDFIEINNCYLKSNIFKKKDELIINIIDDDISSLYLLLPVSLNLAKRIIFKFTNTNDSLLINYEKIAQECNCMITKKENEIICSGSILLDYYDLKDNKSCFFIIGLIINALYTNQAISIKFDNLRINIKDIITAIDVFRNFGFDISYDTNMIYVHSKRIAIWDNYFIEGDYRQALYYIVLACLNGSLTAYNLYSNSIQKEFLLLEDIKKMGGNIRFINTNQAKSLYASNNSLLEKGIAKQLKAIDFDVFNYTEMVCLMMVACSYANGNSKFYNINKLSDKDLNTINNMIDNLKKLGVNILIYDNYFIIKGKKEYNNHNLIINSFNNENIAMALIVFSLLNKGAIIIENIDCILNSYPDFIDDLIKKCKSNSLTLINTKNN